MYLESSFELSSFFDDDYFDAGAQTSDGCLEIQDGSVVQIDDTPDFASVADMDVDDNLPESVDNHKVPSASSAEYFTGTSTLVIINNVNSKQFS